MDFLKRAFSLVELMITLIVVAILTAAMAPVITKRLKSKEITVIQGSGGGNGEVSTDCGGLFNEDCKLCNINFCLECDKTCEDGTYKNISRCNCISCESYDTACSTCDSIGCLTCKTDYKLENGVCKMNAITREFITAGTHEFIVPDGVTSLNVTLISGGGGGGGGRVVNKTASFVTYGNANIIEDENNVVYQDSSGIIVWTIPQSVKGNNVLVSACGGGGGGGDTYAGANGGIINDVNIPMPNEETIKIHIGGGGGTIGQTGLCSNGGSGSSEAGVSSGCNSLNGFGAGAARVWSADTVRQGTGGYDPVYGGHGANGQVQSAHASNWAYGTTGSLIGGGGGSTANGGAVSYGGGGGGATLFLHPQYANIANWVAHGGNGGNGVQIYPGNWYNLWGSGGGGGGVYKADIGSSIFGDSYCYGGIPWSNGLSGAMRIKYNDNVNGGSGGGGGQIVSNQTITVTPGDTLTITVGAGGAGGEINSQGGAGGISKIVNSSGITLISTLGTAATGGYSNGTTAGNAGAITNGKSSSSIISNNYSNTSGSTTTTTTGGAGGKTIMEDSEIHCSAGGGGESNTAGANATGYGGCAGGGGGAGATGGNGAVGYVKIKYGG